MKKILVWNSMKWFLKVQQRASPFFLPQNTISVIQKRYTGDDTVYVQACDQVGHSNICQPITIWDTLMWDSYKIAISNIHAILNLYFSFEVIWGRNSSRKLKFTDFMLSMLTEWLRNDATKANLKHWMWQMWHYST